MAKGVVVEAGSTRNATPKRLLLLSFGLGEGGTTVVPVSGAWLERGKTMLDLNTERKARELNDGMSDAVVVMVFVSLIEEAVELACDGVGEGGGR